MFSDPNCIFCKIVARSAPAAIIYENDGALAFLDLNPVPEGHALIVPKTHCRNLYDFPDDAARDVLRAARVTANALRDTLKSDGMSMVMASERAGGQDVFHAHFHLYPRWNDDGMSRMGRARDESKIRRGNGSREGLEKLAEKIRERITL
ncbi:MAG: HIT family protein [Chloroflexi bacterium]|nr:HIT family protein [Chloroflexota bacterium]